MISKLAYLPTQIVKWLTQNITLNLILVGLYVMSIIFLHDPMVNLSVVIMNALTLQYYNIVVAIVVSVLAILFIYVLYREIKTYPENKKYKLSVLAILVGIIIIHALTMFEMNIEIIHSFQYSVLAILLFPFVNRFSGAVFLCIPIMILDEWHQCYELYTYVEYYEFNDIVMDILGAGFAMVVLWIVGVFPTEANTPIFKRPELWLFIIIILLFFILVGVCWFSFYPATACDNTVLILNKLDSPENFWRVHPLGATYHVLLPGEAIGVISFLTLSLLGIDFLAIKKLKKAY